VPSATFTPVYALVADVAHKKHNLGSDTLKVALTNTAPTQSNTVLANITEVSYTYCSSRTLTISSSGQTSGVYKLVIADLTLTASGGSVGPWQYAVVYNDTATNDELIGYLTYPASITMYDADTFLLDFSSLNGMLQFVIT